MLINPRGGGDFCWGLIPYLTYFIVIPRKRGIPSSQLKPQDPGLRRDDDLNCTLHFKKTPEWEFKFPSIGSRKNEIFVGPDCGGLILRVPL